MDLDGKRDHPKGGVSRSAPLFVFAIYGGATESGGCLFVKYVDYVHMATTDQGM